MSAISDTGPVPDSNDVVPFSVFLDTLQVSRVTGWKMRKNGVVKACGFGRRLFITKKEIARFVRACERGKLLPSSRRAFTAGGPVEAGEVRTGRVASSCNSSAEGAVAPATPKLSTASRRASPAGGSYTEVGGAGAGRVAGPGVASAEGAAAPTAPKFSHRKKS